MDKNSIARLVAKHVPNQAAADALLRRYTERKKEVASKVAAAAAAAAAAESAIQPDAYGAYDLG